jgi:hypothetical protein
MAHADNLYEVLQVSPKAEPEIIEAAYRRLARKYHPDVSPPAESAARMQQIVLAFEVLGDPARRAEYDARLCPERTPGGRQFAWWSGVLVAAAVLLVLALTPARVIVARWLPVILVALLVAGVVWYLWRRSARAGN